MSFIPVFMYHHVSPHKDDMVTVTPDIFEAQMKFLSEAGYKTLSSDELVGLTIGSHKIQEKAVAVTFDDGYLDNYLYAFPVLKKYQVKAAIFIVTNWVEKSSEFKAQGSELMIEKMPNHKDAKRLIEEGKMHKAIMNWDMIKEMQESGLVEFYSHTISHRKCAEMPDDELLRELEDSKKIIEQELNKPCPYLCWPKGSYNMSSVEIAKKAGYTALFTTKRGVIKAGSDRYCIERIVAKNSVGWFKNRARIYTNSLLSKGYLSLRGKK